MIPRGAAGIEAAQKDGARMGHIEVWLDVPKVASPGAHDLDGGRQFGEIEIGARQPIGRLDLSVLRNASVIVVCGTRSARLYELLGLLVAAPESQRPECLVAMALDDPKDGCFTVLRKWQEVER